MVINIQLNNRQKKIIEIVKGSEPITGEEIANRLNLNRSTIRPDLTILTMAGILDARPRVGYFFTGKSEFNLMGDRINSILVEDVKSLPIVVDESTSIYDAVVTMFLEDVGSIYITNNNILTGVISRKDIIRSAIGGTDLHKVPVGVIMTRIPKIVYIKPKDTILDAAKKLIEHEVDSLPVVEVIDEENKELKIIGRITKTTITRLFMELASNT